MGKLFKAVPSEHRMDFCRFHCNVVLFLDFFLSCYKSLKSMTTLMCHNIHVTACSVDLDYEDDACMNEGRFWQKQQHIFASPFYYIDYCLAQTCALQFKAKMEEDFSAAWDKLLYGIGRSPILPLGTDLFTLRTRPMCKDAFTHLNK